MEPSPQGEKEKRSLQPAQSIGIQLSTEEISSALSRVERIQLAHDPDLLESVISALYSPVSNDQIRKQALSLLEPLVVDNQLALSAVTHIAESGTLLSIDSSPDVRIQSLRILEKLIRRHFPLTTDERSQKSALDGILQALRDPSGKVRKTALRMLTSQIERREVYEEVSQILVPSEQYDLRLRMDFDIRAAAVRVLKPVIEIPYVRDIFVSALKKPEPNFEVRLPMLDALKELVARPAYQLAQDDGEAMQALFHRRDSTKKIQDWQRGITHMVLRESPGRYEEGIKLGELRTRNSLETILEDQPFVQFIYTHVGHLLKPYERTPLIDTTRAWPIHHRYFLNEQEIRKLWADNNMTLSTRSTLKGAMKVELARYIEGLEDGGEPNTPLLADMLAFCVWTKERGFHGEFTRLMKFRDQLEDQPQCIEQFTVPELFDFYDQLIRDYELEKRRERVAFFLRDESLYYMGDSAIRKSHFQHQLATFEEAVTLKRVTSESMHRFGKSLLQFYRNDPQQYFEALGQVAETNPTMLNFLKLTLDRAPVTQEDGRFREASERVLDFGKAEVSVVVRERYEELEVLRQKARCDDLLSKIELVYQRFPSKIHQRGVPFHIFAKALVHFEEALQERILGPEQLGKLGGIMDFLYRESETPSNFLRRLSESSQNLSRPMRSVLVLAASDYAPELRKVISTKQLINALLDTD